MPAIDRHVEMNRYAQRKMDAAHKPIDDLLALLGCEMRKDGAPRMSPVTILGRLMIQGPLGAAQIGAPTEMPDELAVIDWAVAQLPDIKRKVFEINYVRFPHAAREMKRSMLKRMFGVHMSESAYTTNLSGLREIVSVLYRVKCAELNINA